MPSDHAKTINTRSGLIADRFVSAMLKRYGAYDALARTRRLRWDRGYSHKPRWLELAIEALAAEVERRKKPDAAPAASVQERETEGGDATASP